MYSVCSRNNSNSEQVEELAGQIKQEPTDIVENTKGGFELPEQNIIEWVKVEEKIKIEEPPDYKNLLNTPLKTESDSFFEEKPQLNHHKPLGSKKCKYCEYVAVNQVALLAHRIENHSTHKCRFCDYVTVCRLRVEAHENAIHLKKEKYLCLDCNYMSMYKCNMVRHKKRMHKEIYLHCKKCDYKTKIQCRLENHIKTNHVKSKLNTYAQIQGEEPAG